MSKRPTCVWDPGGIAAGKSTVVVIPIEKQDGLFLAAIINSQPMSEIYHSLFGSLSLSGGYLRFGPPQLRALPIPEASKGERGLPVWPRGVPTPGALGVRSGKRKSTSASPPSTGSNMECGSLLPLWSARASSLSRCLNETIRLMAEIDKVIEAHGGWPAAFVIGKEP